MIYTDLGKGRGLKSESQIIHWIQLEMFPGPSLAETEL